MEDFESRCKISTGIDSLPIGERYPVVVPGLTDHPQWDNADTKVFSYSNVDLNAGVDKPESADGEKMLVRGEGSVVEGVVQQLRQKASSGSEQLPARVMLTGTTSHSHPFSHTHSHTHHLPPPPPPHQAREAQESPAS